MMNDDDSFLIILMLKSSVERVNNKFVGLVEETK